MALTGDVCRACAPVRGRPTPGARSALRMRSWRQQPATHSRASRSAGDMQPARRGAGAAHMQAGKGRRGVDRGCMCRACAPVRGRPTPGARSALRMRSWRQTATMRSRGNAPAAQNARP